MSTTRRLLAGAVHRTGRLLPDRALGVVEYIVQREQGKGWGAKSLDQEVRACLSLLPSEVRSAPVALDVGANIGNWTASLLSQAPASEVIAFEPGSNAFKQLAERFSTEDRVNPVNVGLSNEAGYVSLYADTPGSGLSSFSQRRLDHFGIEFGYSEQVATMTADEWCSTHSVRPNILKMDVEGHEMAVLQGALETVEAVQVAQFEFGGCNIDSRTFFQDFYYFFTERGFRLYRLGPRGLTPIKRYFERDESFVTTNYFAQRT